MARTFAEFQAQVQKRDEERAKAAATVAPPAPTVAELPLVAPRRAPEPVEAPPAPKLEKVPKIKKPAGPSAPKLTRPDAAIKAPKQEKFEAPKPAQTPALRELPLPPDLDRVIDYREFYDNAGGDLDGAKRTTAERLGLPVDELDRVAAVQGVDLNDINEQKKQGKSYDNVRSNAVQRGVLGFLPVAQRGDLYFKTARTIADSVAGRASEDRVELKKEAGYDEGWLGGYLAPGVAHDYQTVSKPGEYGYLASSLLVEALQKDPEASKLYDLYGRGLATGNTQKYIEKRAQQLLASSGGQGPDAPERLKRFRRRATKEVLAYKTIGQWTPVVVAQDVQLTDDAEAPGFFAATGPNVELIGVNNEGQAIFRQESPLGVVFRFIDIPQAAVSGMLMGDTAAEGVQTGANIFELAMEKTKDQPAIVREAAMVAGFAGAVIFPDLLWGLAAAAKGGKAVTTIVKTRKAAKSVAALLETASEARAAGRFEEAVDAERKLRQLAPKAADDLDRFDANAASMMRLVEPVGDTLDERLVEVLASVDGELAAERLQLHPSARKAVLSGETARRGVPFPDYANLYDTPNLLRRVEDAKQAFIARAGQSVADYVSNTARGIVRGGLRRAVDEGLLTSKQLDELADIVAQRAPLALTDEAKFAEAVRDALKAHPEFSKPQYNILRQSMHAPGASRVRNRLMRAISDVKGKSVEEIHQSELALFDRVTKAINENNQARAVGAALLREEVLKAANIKAQPTALFDEVAVKGADGKPLRLSAGGVLWLRRLRNALPDTPFDQVYGVATIVDTMVQNAAKKGSMDAFDLYATKMADIERATLSRLADFGIKPPMPVAPVRGAAATAKGAAAVAGKAAKFVKPNAPQATKTMTTTAQTAKVAAQKAALPAHAVAAAAAPSLLPPGWKAVSIASVDEAKDALLDAVEGGLPYAQSIGMKSDGTFGALAVGVGDVKLVASQVAPGQYDVLVVVGNQPPKIIRNATGEMAGLKRAVDEAGKIMEARVKNGEPAIVGAPKAPTAPVAPAPAAALPVKAGAPPAPAPVPAAPAAPAAPVALVSELQKSFKDTNEFRKAIETVGGTGFTTAKGSVYQQVGPVTQRFKSYHVMHGKTDVGLKPPSKRTVYLKASVGGKGEDLLRETGIGAGNARSVWLVDDAKKQVYLATKMKSGPRAGEFLFDTVRKLDDGRFVPFVDFSDEPFVGATVLEFYDDVAPIKVKVADGRYADFPGHTSFHPGNEITEIFGAPPAVSKAIGAADEITETMPAARAATKADEAADEVLEVTEEVTRPRAAAPVAPEVALTAEEARLLEEMGLSVRRGERGLEPVGVLPDRRSTARVIEASNARLAEERTALETLRRAVDSGAPGAVDEYLDAARAYIDGASGSIGGVMARALAGDEDAVAHIVRLGDEIKATDVAMAVVDGRRFGPGEFFESADELEAARRAYTAEQAELRAARAAPEVFERAAEEAPAVAKAPSAEVASVLPAQAEAFQITSEMARSSMTARRLAEAALAGEKTADAAVNYVMSTTTNPFYRRLAERLLATDELQRFKFKFVSDTEAAFMRMPSSASGMADTAGRQVIVRAISDGPVQRFVPVEEVILHEAVHATTARRMDAARALPPGNPLRAAHDEIESAYRRAIAVRNQRVKAGTGTAFETGTRLNYILSNSREFVAFAMTEPNFQAWLKTVQVGPKAKATLWDKFVDSVASLLGLQRGDNTMLAQVIDRTDELMRVSQSDLTAAARDWDITLSGYRRYIYDTTHAQELKAGANPAQAYNRATDAARAAYAQAKKSGRLPDTVTLDMIAESRAKVFGATAAPVVEAAPAVAKAEGAASTAPATPVANVAADIAQEGAGETPVYRSINLKREAEFADVDRIRRTQQVDAMIARLYGKDMSDVWFEIPEQFKVNARARLARAEEALALPTGAKGKITDAEYQRLVANVAADLEDQKRLLEAKAMTRTRSRGADWVRSRILAFKSQGVIDEAGADLVDWFIQQNPRIADDLGVSVTKGGGGIVGGEYTPASRIITLFKEGGDELTAVHEVLHHTERMLPDALQAAVRKEWARQVTKVLPTVEGDARKLLQDLLVGKANPDKVMELVGEGKIPYALLNPSEFWAVNASRIVSGRYAAFNAGLVAKAKQWLTEFVQKAKSLFGLASDAALIRGLDDVLKGDGTFVSKMLAEGEVFRSVNRVADVAAEGAEESRVLKQLGAGGEVKGATVLTPEGRSLILLFDNADASTALHEVAHVMRREFLATDDMDAITAWVRARGVKVTHRFGEFVGDAAEVERAEELFAKAFEAYVRKGVSPSPVLAGAFKTLKVAVAQVYRNVVDPVIGKDLDPEVSAVFNRMLQEVPADEAPSLISVMRRQMLGQSEETADVLNVLSAEAMRRGIPKSTADDLAEKVSKATTQMEIAEQLRSGASKSLAEAADAVRKRRLGSKTKDLDPTERGVLAATASPKATPDPIAISFPVPILGKKDWSFDDLAEFQLNRETSVGIAAERQRGIMRSLSKRGTDAPVQEATPVEVIRSAVAYDATDPTGQRRLKTLGRGVVGLFFGGDVVGDVVGGNGMRLLTPELRKAIDTTARVVEQSVGDVITLANDALDVGRADQLYRYLGGAGDIRRVKGRPIVSAGHDYMGSVQQMIRRNIDTMTDEQKAGLVKLCDALNIKDGEARGRALSILGYDAAADGFKMADEARQQTQTAAAQAIYKLLYAKGLQNEADFGSSLAAALRGIIDAKPTARPTYEMRVVELMSYVSGYTARNGKVFTGTSEQAAKLFATSLADIYSSEEMGRRAAVVIGGFGAASLGKDVLARMNLAISPEAYSAFTKWIAGEQWDPRYTEQIQRIVDRYGFNPEFVADPVLGGTSYVPRLARERMAEALARANYRPSGTVDPGDAVNMAYRYMKTRMTRGSFFVRQKYYMMNTMDHFIQMGIQNGFGVAAASTARLLAQDVMVLPFWQQLVEVARKLPGGERIPADQLERFRRTLQTRGDRFSNQIGRMFSVSKYRIEVNPILEGVDGGFVVGGKAYRNRDVRSIAVQEGVFASYDTRLLANAIEREGALFFQDTINGMGTLAAAGTEGGRLRKFMADWMGTVSDTAEAWGERERLGAMITLMEAGYDPRTAARLAVDALYDYSQSLSKADRSLLVGVMFPFWAFQKNANQQVFNLIFSPAGAYRMGVIRRAREIGADALTELLYGDVGNEYGVDVESMPPELQDSYYAIVSRFEGQYGGKPPPEAKRALRMLFQGRGRIAEQGKNYELSGALQEVRNRGGFAELQRFAAFTVGRPSKSNRPTYLRDREGIAVPFPRTEIARAYYSLTGSSHSYLELFLPESTIESGMRHIATMSAALILMGAAPADLLSGGALSQEGYEEVKLKRVLEPITDPSRSPLIAPLIAGGAPELSQRRKLSATGTAAVEGIRAVHPFIGKQIDDLFGTTLLRVPANVDPFAVDPETGKLAGMPPEEAERIKRLQEQFPEVGVLRQERYYIAGDAWVTAFDNLGLGELNAKLLAMEGVLGMPGSPAERIDPRGQLLGWAQFLTGVDVVEISPDATMRREEPKKLQYTKEI